MNSFKIFFLLTLLHLTMPVYSGHHPQKFLKSIAGSKDEGNQIVQHFCISCHGSKPLIPLGAPRMKSEEDWKLRAKQGLNLLFTHTSEGINAMPPRGGCFECSDHQLLLAIYELLPEKAKKELKNKPKGNKISKK